MEAIAYGESLDGRRLRLVTVYPGTDKEEIQVSIDVVAFSLQNPPEYEALSYVWGSESDKVRIHVVQRIGGRCGPVGNLMVTQNLHVALKHMRLPDRPRVMWVDSICINQEDLLEKGHQVAMMGKIYRLAHRVVAWLGPSHDGSDHAMEIMQYIGSQTQIDFNSRQIIPVAGATDKKIGGSHDHTHSPCTPAERQSLSMLLQRSWFDRIWIRQEIFLGKPDSSLMCGLSAVPWPVFRKAMAVIYFKSYWTKYNSADDHQRFMILHRLRGFIFQHPSMGLEELRRNCGNAQCKDPRDRIYAVLEMLDNRNETLGITPDYTKSMLEVYRDATIRWLTYSGKADYLKQCGLNPGAGALPFASWIPDFSRPRILQFEEFKGYTSSSLAACYNFRSGSDVLSLAGVFVSKIGESRIPGAGLDYMEHDQQLYRMKQMLEFVKSSVPKDVQGEDRFIWRARVHLADTFDTLYYPPMGRCPSLQEAIEGLKVGDSPSMSVEAIHGDGGTGKFLRQVFGVSMGRQLCLCTDNLPIWAPQSAQEGDIVCIFLGCESLMLVRPVSLAGDCKYRLVGPCWRVDACYGETVLGRLPEGIRGVINSETLKWGLLDEKKGMLINMDPRFNSFPAGLLDLEGHQRDLQDNPHAPLRVSPEILNEHARGLKTDGRKIQFIELI